MLKQLQRAGLVWATLMTAAGLAVLIGLGTWQLERKAWKDGIIAGLKAGAKRSPAAFDEWLKSAGSDAAEFVRVEASGRFQHDQEAYAYTVRNGQAGYGVYTPLRLNNGGVVVTNRGFVPEKLREPSTRPGSQPAGAVVVRGLTRRAPARSYFTPPDDAKRRISYGGLPQVLAAQGEATGTSPGIYIEVEPAAAQSGWPKGRSGADLLKIIPNRHLEYALTWYGLAATLLAVFATFAAGRLRVAGQ